MNRKLSAILGIAIIGITLLATHATARDWSKNELVGTHIFEGANGFAIFSDTHLMWILNNTAPDTEDGKPADLLASLKGEAVGGTYKVTGEDRMSLQITHAMDVQMVGQQWQYEMQWIDQNRVRFWVLNPDGSRSERTGIARKVN